jgi:hypothetical protein
MTNIGSFKKVNAEFQGEIVTLTVQPGASAWSPNPTGPTGLRPCDPRHRRERDRTRCQMQKSTARKIHRDPPVPMKLPHAPFVRKPLRYSRFQRKPPSSRTW